jgi:signal transduction histidine kinase
VEQGKFVPDVLPVDDPFGLKGGLTGQATFHDFVQKGVAMRSYSVPFVEKGRVAAVIQSVTPKTPVLRQLRELDRALVMSIPAGLLLAGLGGFLLVGAAMRPLRRLIEASNGLEADLSERRLPIEGSDEFAALATSFNVALDRTAGAFAVQRRSLEQLERFTADAGHELRTPLGAIKGSSSFLLHLTEVPAEVRPSLCMIDRSADRMAKLIDDLLLLARHDAGRYQASSGEVFVRDLVASVIEEIEAKYLMDRDSIPEVQVEIADDLCVLSDEGSLQRIVTNLLSNALKYARDRVTVRATWESGKLTIEVRDDGEGIPAEHLSRLGERFYRPDESRSRNSGGSGLGLAIVKSLCESLDGSVTIDSDVGLGTRATVVVAAELGRSRRQAPIRALVR